MDQLNDRGPGGSFRSVIQRMFLSLKDQVVGYLINHGEAKDDAEDICQDAFLRFWKTVERGGEKRMTEAYFWTIVQTQKIRHFQKEQKQPRLIIDKEFCSEIPGAEDVLANRETLEILLEAISSLPPKQKLIFKQKYFEEETPEAIARLAKCTPETVRSHLSQARNTLKVALREAQKPNVGRIGREQ